MDTLTIQTRKGLETINLHPRGFVTVDLLGQMTPEEFARAGSFHGGAQFVEDEQLAAYGKAMDEASALARRMLKAQCALFLEGLGNWADRNQDRRGLRTDVELALMRRWFPYRCVNVKDAA